MKVLVPKTTADIRRDDADIRRVDLEDRFPPVVTQAVLPCEPSVSVRLSPFASASTERGSM